MGLVQTAVSSWIDVTAPIRDGMVHWPGNPPVELARTLDLERGDDCTVSRLSLGVHTGTHVDAPVHFMRGGIGVDALPLDALIGPARVISVGGVRSVTAEDLAPHDLREGERVLLKTANSPRSWEREGFARDYVALDLSGARHLVECGVKTVGIDYLSIGGLEDGPEVHHALMATGVCIIEGLDLTSAPAGECELICLPLRLAGADGAPARVVLRYVI